METATCECTPDENLILTMLQPMVRSIARRLTRSWSCSRRNAYENELIQAGMLGAWHSIPQHNAAQGPIEPFLLRAAKWAINDAIRAIQTERKSLTLLPDDFDAVDRSAETINIADLFEANNLSPLQRRLLDRLQSNPSISGIARELDVPVSQVRGCLARIRKKIQREET